MWGELKLRLLAPPARVERRLVAFLPLIPLGALAFHAGWRWAVPSVGSGPLAGAWQAVPWLGCALAVLLLCGLFAARFMTLGRKPEQELAAAIALAAIALLLAEKLRWILAYIAGWTWAGGPKAQELLGALLHEQWFLDRALALPASVFALLWLEIAWVRIERGREEAQAREAARSAARAQPAPGTA